MSYSVDLRVLCICAAVSMPLRESSRGGQPSFSRQLFQRSKSTARKYAPFTNGKVYSM